MATNNRFRGDLSRNMNMIETSVYSAQPLRDYEQPTLRVNANLRGSNYPSGRESVGETIVKDIAPFNVVFEDSREFPETRYDSAESVIESNLEEHQRLSGDKIHVKTWPDYIVEPDLDGSANIEDNDSFNINRI